MTISKDEGIYWVSCDWCSDAHDLDAESFPDAKNEVREAGWRSVPTDRTESGWGDMCPSCIEDGE